jgi:hypothetical protein
VALELARPGVQLHVRLQVAARVELEVAGVDLMHQVWPYFGIKKEYTYTDIKILKIIAFGVYPYLQ